MIGTPHRNSRDMVEAGRSLVGERHHGAKLTETDVRTIYAMCLQGASFTALAKQFAVSDVAISNIAKRKSWKHLTL
jgi:hypothetical protein